MAKEITAAVSCIVINKQSELWIATDGNGFYQFRSGAGKNSRKIYR